MSAAALSAINVYPIKGCRGIPLESAIITPTGAPASVGSREAQDERLHVPLQCGRHQFGATRRRRAAPPLSNIAGNAAGQCPTLSS